VAALDAVVEDDQVAAQVGAARQVNYRLPAPHVQAGCAVEGELRAENRGLIAYQRLEAPAR
jgi:hypothetical protein